MCDFPHWASSFMLYLLYCAVNKNFREVLLSFGKLFRSFREFFEIFASFFEVFVSFSKFLDVFGPIRIHSDPFVKHFFHGTISPDMSIV